MTTTDPAWTEDDDYEYREAMRIRLAMAYSDALPENGPTELSVLSPVDEELDYRPKETIDDSVDPW